MTVEEEKEVVVAIGVVVGVVGVGTCRVVVASGVKYDGELVVGLDEVLGVLASGGRSGQGSARLRIDFMSLASGCRSPGGTSKSALAGVGAWAVSNEGTREIFR